MFKKINLLVLLSSLTYIDGINAAIDGNAIMRAMLSHRPRIYLLSYPRSGNTWMRYCIEVLTERPTAGFTKNPKLQALPFGYECSYPLDFKKRPIWKVHSRGELNFAAYKYNPQRDLLIFLIRNPKESVVRQSGKTNLGGLLTGDGLKNFQTYFDDLALYHTWNSKKKILIYYEDMISRPREVMASVIRFLGDDQNKFDDFFNDYERHKAIALKLYEYNGGSQTQGNDVLYHSRKLT